MSLSDTQRTDILILLGCGDKTRTQKQVWEIFNTKYPDRRISQSTVSRIENKFREFGNVMDIPKSGRKRILDDEQKLNILLDIQDNPHKHTRQVAVDNDVSKTSILRLLKHEKYCPYKIHLGCLRSSGSILCKGTYSKPCPGFLLRGCRTRTKRSKLGTTAPHSGDRQLRTPNKEPVLRNPYQGPMTRTKEPSPRTLTLRARHFSTNTQYSNINRLSARALTFFSKTEDPQIFTSNLKERKNALFINNLHRLIMVSSKMKRISPQGKPVGWQFMKKIGSVRYETIIFQYLIISNKNSRKINGTPDSDTDKSAATEHVHTNEDHRIDYEDMRVRDHNTRYYPRIIRESLEIMKNNNNFNREDGYRISNTWGLALLGTGESHRSLQKIRFLMSDFVNCGTMKQELRVCTSFVLR
ncbi:hypothetical protein NQ318_012836 [Aromia moschata]|uniref:DUF4817 domain-containing protein n=1 Tax=Aromia moschata TaxID=1265417 RepID=A0AAV8X7P2_9CUCU|nr:hypothetical protein NQ318_012836 [Aromia moschata]